MVAVSRAIPRIVEDKNSAHSAPCYAGASVRTTTFSFSRTQGSYIKKQNSPDFRTDSLVLSLIRRQDAGIYLPPTLSIFTDNWFKYILILNWSVFSDSNLYLVLTNPIIYFFVWPFHIFALNFCIYLLLRDHIVYILLTDHIMHLLPPDTGVYLLATKHCIYLLPRDIIVYLHIAKPIMDLLANGLFSKLIFGFIGVYLTRVYICS